MQNTSTEKSLPYNQVMHPRCLSHRMLSRKEIEGANQSPPKNDKTTEDRFSTPIFSPAKVNPQGEYQIPLKPGEDNPKGNNIVRIQVGKKNTTVINHLLQIKPQIKKVVTDKKGAANASINKNQNVSLLNGAYNVSDSKVGVENFLFDKVIGIKPEIRLIL